MIAALFAAGRAAGASSGAMYGLVMDVLGELAERKVSIAQAEERGRVLASLAGDVRIKVKGADIIDDETQALLGRCAGRIAANLYRAVTA